MRASLNQPERCTARCKRGREQAGQAGAGREARSQGGLRDGTACRDVSRAVCRVIRRGFGSSLRIQGEREGHTRQSRVQDTPVYFPIRLIGTLTDCDLDNLTLIGAHYNSIHSLL